MAAIPFEMASTQHRTTLGEKSTSLGGEQMIQPLRSAHRRAWFALAVVLPALLVVGLMARRPRLIADSRINDSEALVPIRQSDHLWAKHTIHSAFLRRASDPTKVQVVLEPLDDLSVPDLLVYWSAEMSGNDNLPANAVLLGTFKKSSPLLLRESDRKGFLILYSLAHQSIVDAASLESAL